MHMSFKDEIFDSYVQYHPGEDIRPPVVDFNAPPPYEMPVKLPTYEEVQREKALEGELVPPAVSFIHFYDH